MNGDEFDLRYDMIVLDEIESVMNHFDEGAMNHKDIDIWFFFSGIMKHSKKLIMMDGDISSRTFRLASLFGQMVYVNNNNNEINKGMQIVVDHAKWNHDMHKDRPVQRRGSAF